MSFVEALGGILSPLAQMMQLVIGRDRMLICFPFLFSIQEQGSFTLRFAIEMLQRSSLPINVILLESSLVESPICGASREALSYYQYK